MAPRVLPGGARITRPTDDGFTVEFIETDALRDALIRKIIAARITFQRQCQWAAPVKCACRPRIPVSPAAQVLARMGAGLHIFAWSTE